MSRAVIITTYVGTFVTSAILYQRSSQIRSITLPPTHSSPELSLLDKGPLLSPVPECG